MDLHKLKYLTKGYVLVAGALMWCATPGLKADELPKLTVLKTFSALDSNGFNEDGAGPDSRPVFGHDGLLYGMTNGPSSASNGGGRYGNGVIYRFNPHTRDYTVLHAFSALDPSGTVNSDGALPGVGLIRGPDNTFYGQMQFGGEEGSGTVFKITASGQFEVLHTYSAVKADGTNADGANPLRTLVFGADGNLYGTTRLGGPHAVNGRGLGVAWMMDPRSGSFTVIHAFTADEGHAASLIQARDGFFYGCAVWPISALGSGTLFRMAPGYYETLYRFSSVDAKGKNADGAECYEPLLERRAGQYYGSTTYGGLNGNGTVFKFSLASGQPKLKTLHSFGAVDAYGINKDGANPRARLVLGPDGALYSTASFGGAGGTGVIYRVSNSSYHVLYSFTAVDANLANSDGAYPDFGVLLGHDGDCDEDQECESERHVALYGTALNGGTTGNGTIYRLRLAE